MSNLHNSLKRVPKSAWWISALLLSYALLGFLLAPWLAERQVRGILDERLALTTEIESIYFNPFTFYARIDGLNIADQDGAPLLQTGTLIANFQPTRLLLLRLQFAALSVQDLDFFFQRNQEGQDTLSQLAQAWAATAPTTAAADPETEPEDDQGGPVPIQIDDIILADLNFHIRDAVPATVFESSLRLAEAHISDLSTLADREGTNALSIEFEDEAHLDWDGELQLNPPLFSGHLNLENFALGVVSRYLQDQLPFALESGRLAASFAYAFDLSQPEMTVELDQIDVSIDDLSAVQDGREMPFLNADLVHADNGRLRIPANQIELDNLQFNQVELTINRETAATSNIQEMIAAMSTDAVTEAQSAAAGGSPPSAPWEISLLSLVLDSNRITFNDASLETPTTLGMLLDLELSDLSNQEGALFPLNANLQVDSGGNLEVQGELGVLPVLNLNSSASLQELDLTVLQPYISEYAFVELQSALLDLDSELLIDADEAFAYRGDLRLSSLSVLDQQRQENLASMETLTISEIDYSVAENALDISEILLDAPFARIRIDEDGSTNVGRVVKPSTESNVEPSPSPENELIDTESAPIRITVGRIALSDGGSDFTDLDLPIPFNADIRELTGTAEGFSAPSSQPVEFVLEGNVDEYGLVELDSSFNPFDISEQSQIDLRFRNLDLPPLTPYTIKFAGREIANGNMEVDLSYNLQDGQLTASNQVLLRDLRLGEQVDSPDAMDLPLDLALALLKDSRGVIDLAVPVSGDVNSPDFDIAPAIRGAIANVLTNIVSAPFRLLGSLVGGGSNNDVSSIQFRVGRSDLAPPERQLLERLSEALIQRPELVLEIPLLRTEADRLALQSQLLSETINARISALPEGEASLTDQRLAVLEALYQEAGLSPSLEVVQSENNIETSVPNPLTGEPLVSEQLDVQGYINDIRDRLVAVEPVPETQLDELAAARAAAVQDFLMAGGQLSPTQLQTTAPQTAEPDDNGWLLMEFGLGTL